MTGQRIWITGASSGIGYELAKQYLDRGERVAVSARSERKLVELRKRDPKEASANDIASSSERCLILPLDVTDYDGTRDTIEQIYQTWGGLDLAILNAGTYSLRKEKEVSLEDFNYVFDVNLMGVVRALEFLLPRMREQGGGQIAITSSLSGYVGLPHAWPYAASKAALNSFCESLRPELQRDNIYLTVINPGFVTTPMTDKNDFPMPFIISVEEAARVIVRQLQDRRYEIRFPWRMVWVMRLLRLLPSPLYFMITRTLVRDR